MHTSPTAFEAFLLQTEEAMAAHVAAHPDASLSEQIDTLEVPLVASDFDEAAEKDDI